MTKVIRTRPGALDYHKTHSGNSLTSKLKLSEIVIFLFTNSPISLRFISLHKSYKTAATLHT